MLISLIRNTVTPLFIGSIRKALYDKSDLALGVNYDLFFKKWPLKR